MLSLYQRPDVLNFQYLLIFSMVFVAPVSASVRASRLAQAPYRNHGRKRIMRRVSVGERNGRLAANQKTSGGMNV
jgi:hypothetical protein